MDETAPYTCPCCGERIETPVDPSGGAVQEYTDDCPVCCRPVTLRVRFDDAGGATITAEPEGGSV